MSKTLPTLFWNPLPDVRQTAARLDPNNEPDFWNLYPRVHPMIRPDLTRPDPRDHPNRRYPNNGLDSWNRAAGSFKSHLYIRPERRSWYLNRTSGPSDLTRGFNRATGSSDPQVHPNSIKFVVFHFCSPVLHYFSDFGITNGEQESDSGKKGLTSNVV